MLLFVYLYLIFADTLVLVALLAVDLFVLRLCFVLLVMLCLICRFSKLAFVVLAAGTFGVMLIDSLGLVLRVAGFQVLDLLPLVCLCFGLFGLIVGV